MDQVFAKVNTNNANIIGLYFSGEYCKYCKEFTPILVDVYPTLLDNNIDIVALNQGLAGPNTATFAIYDENDNLITTNDWNLNTGVAAKFVIEYVKPIEKK